MQSYRKYKEHFLKLIDLEREEEMTRHLDEINNMTGKKREEAGRAMLYLSGKSAGKGLGGAHLVKLTRTGNAALPQSEITVGDVCILSKGSPTGKESQATVTEKTPFTITLAYSGYPPEYSYNSRLRLDLFVNDIPFKRMEEAIIALKKKDKLRELLTGPFQPGFDQTERCESPSLNSSQNEALQNALDANDLYLVHGPPGTGKTTTLVEIIREHVNRGVRVLAGADSNTAIDNIVEKLASKGLRVVRVGNPARITPSLLEHTLDKMILDDTSWHEARKLWDQVDIRKEEQRKYTPPSPQNKRGMRNSQIREMAARGRSFRGVSARQIDSMANWIDYQEEISILVRHAKNLEEMAIRKVLRDADVVACTNSTAGGDLLANEKFGLVVIDEATQAVEPSCIIPMTRGNKFILAGDHKQLPPTVLHHEARTPLQKSLFERLIDKYRDEIVSLLSIQYRMNNSIMEFSNREFYDGKLKAHPSVANETLGIVPGEGTPPWIRQIFQAENPVNFITYPGIFREEQNEQGSRSYFNGKEISLVEKIVEEMLRSGVPAHTIGIISPYAAQVKLFKERLEVEGLEIKTVDGFQGREKDVIIISFVRSGETGEIGFLSDFRRLNVAITRARRKLVLVGNAELLEKNPIYSRLISGIGAVRVEE